MTPTFNSICLRCQSSSVRKINVNQIECQKCKFLYDLCVDPFKDTKYVFEYRDFDINYVDDEIIWKVNQNICIYYKSYYENNFIQIPYLPFDITGDKLKTYILFS